MRLQSQISFQQVSGINPYTRLFYQLAKIQLIKQKRQRTPKITQTLIVDL